MPEVVATKKEVKQVGENGATPRITMTEKGALAALTLKTSVKIDSH